MTKGKAIVMILVLVVLAGAAAILLSNNDKDSTTNTNTAATSQETKSEPAASQSTGEVATITYSDNGFSPSTITVKSGTTVTIKNNSSHGLQFDSDPHPAHTDDEELNVNSVPEGGSETFVVKRTGTFGYHNHLNPGNTGTIVVE